MARHINNNSIPQHAGVTYQAPMTQCELALIHRWLEKNKVKCKFSDEVVLKHYPQQRRSAS